MKVYPVGTQVFHLPSVLKDILQENNPIKQIESIHITQEGTFYTITGENGRESGTGKWDSIPEKYICPCTDLRITIDMLLDGLPKEEEPGPFVE